MSIYTERKECIMCKSDVLEQLWEKDFSIALGCYACDTKEHDKFYMPFNILKCKECYTHQTQYIGNPNIIYNYEAKFFGSIRSTMNELFAKFILENNKVQHILDIGAGNGSISEYILNSKKINYDIVDPTYSGNESDRTIHRTFIEDLKEDIKADTVIMSHVFEHFYDPIKIMDIFYKNKTIKHIYLNFPDLEKYIKTGNYHVLNPEHIFYVENQYIIELFKKYGFELKRNYYHEEHSVFFEFIRTNDTITNTKIVNISAVKDVENYFSAIFNKIEYIQKHIINKKTYIWPCSMHTNYLFALGLDKSKIYGILDNAPHKIEKYLYGTDLKCLSFNDIIETTEDIVIILNGGCYNKEILNMFNNKPNITCV